MATVLRIALSVFKESVRDKVLYSLVLFAILMIGASVILGEATAGQELKIIKDLGLTSISLFGLFIAVFIGIGLVSKEVERRSIYSLLCKPMTRPQFLLGKFCGLLLTLAVNVVVMTAALYLVLALHDWLSPPDVKLAWDAPALDPALLKASLLILCQLAIVTAIALLFSTFSSPVLATALTLGIVIAGHFSADLKNFEMVLDARPLVWLMRGVYYALPNLASFDVTLEVVHARPVAPAYMFVTAGYAGTYTAAVLLLATVIFSRRDFK